MSSTVILMCIALIAITHVISVTESWLNGSVHVYDAKVLFNSWYNIFRRDRDCNASKKKDGDVVVSRLLLPINFYISVELIFKVMLKLSGSSAKLPNSAKFGLELSISP